MASVALDAAALLRAEGTYKPRPLRFIGRERLGDWRLKIYSIDARGGTARPELVDATIALASSVLPRPAVDDQRYGIGFAIAHDAATVCFGLVYWWQSQNELHQRVHMSPRDNPRALAKIADPAAGCVWEMGIIDFERRAWLEDVLANPRGPDLERYLSRELDTEV
jgi:hypothetical protein